MSDVTAHGVIVMVSTQSYTFSKWTNVSAYAYFDFN